MRIYTLLGRHIDLDHVLAVSDARYGSSGPRVELTMALLLEPVVLGREFEPGLDTRWDPLGCCNEMAVEPAAGGDVEWVPRHLLREEQRPRLPALRRFQREVVDPLLAAWGRGHVENAEAPEPRLAPLHAVPLGTRFRLPAGEHGPGHPLAGGDWVLVDKSGRGTAASWGGKLLEPQWISSCARDPEAFMDLVVELLP
jgi:hypothetical protein